MVDVGVASNRGRDVREGVELRCDELDFRRNADGSEQAARGRAEESLREFRVGEVFNFRGKVVADLNP